MLLIQKKFYNFANNIIYISKINMGEIKIQNRIKAVFADFRHRGKCIVIKLAKDIVIVLQCYVNNVHPNLDMLFK